MGAPGDPYRLGFNSNFLEQNMTDRYETNQKCTRCGTTLVAEWVRGEYPRILCPQCEDPSLDLFEVVGQDEPDEDLPF